MPDLNSDKQNSLYVIPTLCDRRLLILSCSRKKRTDSRLLPALERYDGPAFQVLRKFIVECSAEARELDIRILSAKFGLIPADRPIPFYDERMTARRAMALNLTVSAEMERLLAQRIYRKLLINVGQNYYPALARFESHVPDGLEVAQASGSSGRRQTILRDWLRGGPQPLLAVPSQGHARIRGIEIALTCEEVMERASLALVSGNGNPQAYQSWYVQIDGCRVSPKWLVSQLTGIPVGAFVSDEARRVLAQLGIEVRRI
jgi:hypothetical protein